MPSVGYQYAIDRLGLRVLPLLAPASVRSVTRIEQLGSALAVPVSMAPGESVVDHLLFALKHEGTNLQVLAAACPHLEAAELLTALRDAPKGRYTRKLCKVWEQTT